MISSPSSSIPPTSTSKKPRSEIKSPADSKWRTATQQKIYGRRLLEALRSTGGRFSGDSPPAGPQAIKNAADSALALTARGQTRWSRSLLCRRRKILLKAGGKIRRRKPPRPPPAVESPPAMKGRKVRDRLRVLSRLVPGCRKLSPTSLLEETADYMAALEMQVKTMRALAEALAAAALSSPAGDEGGGGDGR